MKPQDHISALIKAASDPTHIKVGRTRQIVSLQQYSEPMTFILHQGTAALYRGQDHLLLTNARAPNIIGLNFLKKDNFNIYLQANGEIRYELLPQAKLKSAIELHNLWESHSYAMMYTSLRLSEFHFDSVGIPTYELIRNNLLALMAEGQEFRLATNACDYIQEKTLLSRSGIMKMLGDLKKGGHISLERGVLLEINHLPAKY